MQQVLELEGHFWDGRHHRRKVVDPTDLVIALAYDHRNPVREAMVACPEDYPRSSAAWWAGSADSPVPLCQRPDLPFGLSREVLRDELIRFQADKRLDDVMEALHKSDLCLAQAEGRAEVVRLLRAAGLDPGYVRHACRT
jgi:hypothetical protein